MNFEELLENVNQMVYNGFIFKNSITLTILIYIIVFSIIFFPFATFGMAFGKKHSTAIAFGLALFSNIFIFITSVFFNYSPISDTKKEAYIQEYLNTEENYTNESIEKYNSKGNQVNFTLKDGTYVSLPAKNVKYDVKNDGIPYYSYVSVKEKIKGEKTYKKGKYNETVHLPENAK